MQQQFLLLETHGDSFAAERIVGVFPFATHGRFADRAVPFVAPFQAPVCNQLWPVLAT